MQQDITWTNDDNILRRHIVSLDHKAPKWQSLIGAHS